MPVVYFPAESCVVPEFLAFSYNPSSYGLPYNICYTSQSQEISKYVLCSPIDIDECATSNAVCEHNCTNTIGSFTCSCDTGYQLDRNGLNCTGENTSIIAIQRLGIKSFLLYCITDIDECENEDLNDCHEDASCTNTKGSYSCSCNDGYRGSGTECTGIVECRY